MSQPNRISLTVVVSGADIPIEANRNERVEKVIRDALREAGQPAREADNWQLRFEDGTPIDPRARIATAGIQSGMVLYLDPREGGGGNSPPAAEVPTLVDPCVSAAKLEAQLDDWDQHATAYRRRGWLLLSRGELEVEVAFAARVPVTPPLQPPLLPVGIRVDFHNYDVWAPSLTFIDPLTGEPTRPATDALNFRPGGRRLNPGEPPELSLLPEHPIHKRPFLCQQGVREYHNHPQHDGDDWLLHRGRGMGTLASICTLVWRLMTRNVIGLSVQAAAGDVQGVTYGVLQGDPDAIAEQQAGAGGPRVGIAA